MELLYLLYIIIAISIAYFKGRERQIGFAWSLFFSLCNPIIGLFIILQSRNNNEPIPEPSKSKKIWGWVLIVLFSIFSIAPLIALSEGLGGSNLYSALGMCIFFIGLGMYLIQLSQERKNGMNLIQDNKSSNSKDIVYQSSKKSTIPGAFDKKTKKAPASKEKSASSAKSKTSSSKKPTAAKSVKTDRTKTVKAIKKK